MRFTRSLLHALIALGLLTGCGYSQSTAPIAYVISFENRAHHEAEITIRYSALGDAPLQLRMSRSSPGRYALHEFAKNVYGFRASGAGGQAVEIWIAFLVK